MMNQQRFEKIQQIVQKVCAVSDWLLPKIFKLFALGLLSIAWLIFYALQFMQWHYAWLIPIVIVSVPLVIVAIWCLLLWDLSDLPEALEDLKNGVIGMKERVNPDLVVKKEPVEVNQASKLPTMLKELWGMVEGVDAVRTVIGHAFFLANPLSWGLLVLAVIVISFYIISASISFLVWLF